MTKKTTEELLDYFFEKVKPFQDKLIENGWIKIPNGNHHFTIGKKHCLCKRYAHIFKFRVHG